MDGFPRDHCSGGQGRPCDWRPPDEARGCLATAPRLLHPWKLRWEAKGRRGRARPQPPPDFLHRLSRRTAMISKIRDPSADAEASAATTDADGRPRTPRKRPARRSLSGHILKSCFGACPGAVLCTTCIGGGRANPRFRPNGVSLRGRIPGHGGLRCSNSESSTRKLRTPSSRNIELERWTTST